MFMLAAVFLTTCQTVFSEMPCPQSLPARQTHRNSGPLSIPAVVMQERADRLGAALKIAVRPGVGTHLRLVIPGSMAFRHEQRASLLGNFYRGLLERLKTTA
jgi:hypothetical protein